MIKLGIAGMGYIGRIHLEASRNVSGTQVLAVASSHPGQIREAFPDVQVYPSYRELVRDERLNAVLICLPTFLHEISTIEGLEQGRDVLCEKPMALDLASTAKMVETASRCGRILMAAQVLRFWPHYVRIKELIETGAIGAIRSVSAYRLGKFPAWGDWFRDPAKSGGCLLDLQVHDVDFIHWLLGQPQEVYTVGIQSSTGSWDHVLTTLRYGGPVATVEASYLMPDPWPFTSSVRILGTEGCLEYVFRVGANIQERAQASHSLRLYGAEGVVSEPSVEAEDAFVAQLAYFVRCIEQRARPENCPPEETREVMMVMTASRQSAESGRPIKLVAGRSVKSEA